jgi:hypothetical protein
VTDRYPDVTDLWDRADRLSSPPRLTHPARLASAERELDLVLVLQQLATIYETEGK